MGEWQLSGFPFRDVGHHRYRCGAADHRLPAKATLTGRRVRGNGRVHCVSYRRMEQTETVSMQVNRSVQSHS